MNKILLFAMAAGILLAFGSCKPKQSAYKAAYEQAKEREMTSPVVEEEVAEEVSIQPVSKPRPSTNQTTRSERINAYQGEDASGLKRFSVVVGSFQNKTNAYSLKERLANEGYRPILGENEQGMLRVIITSFDSKQDAAESRDAVKAKYAPNFQDAWLLERQY